MKQANTLRITEGEVSTTFNPWVETLASDDVIRLPDAPQAVVAPRAERNLVYRSIGKRTLDLTIVLLLAPLWIPLYLAVGLACLIVQGRPVHFKATRPGKHASDFSIMKFRTMHADADKMLPAILAADPDLHEEFKATAKLRQDPRITRLGATLRRLSLDELPQLWNVLRGDMSLVGPRPPATREEMEAFFGDLAGYAFLLRPGLTGMWQVSREADPPYERRVWLDLVYASRCSLWLDLKILIQTVRTVLFGHGAF